MLISTTEYKLLEKRVENSLIISDCRDAMKRLIYNCLLMIVTIQAHFKYVKFYDTNTSLVLKLFIAPH
jgi:hypothetical protein